MYSEIKLISKVKAQITKFSHKVSRSFKKPKGKFIHQMIYGIQAAKDVKLSNIARALNEDISLINRLLKKSFFSQTRPWANKSKILSAGLPGADRSVFEK